MPSLRRVPNSSREAGQFATAAYSSSPC